MEVTINILVGTMTGTAQLCAQEMELALDDGETKVATLMMDNLDSSVFTRSEIFPAKRTGTSTRSRRSSPRPTPTPIRIRRADRFMV